MARPDDPATIDWLHPDYDAVLAARAERLERLRADRTLLAEALDFYRHDPASLLHDWGVLSDPRVVGAGRQAVMPMLLMPKQREMLNWIIERWRHGEPGVIEKSRGIGASWLVAALSVALCLLHRNLVIGFGSAKEDSIDRSGDPETLLGRARFFLQHLPREFKQGWTLKHSAHLRLSFPMTGSAIIGEAGDNIGRGSRSGLFFLDESSHIERPKLVDAALVANTDTRIDVSSVRGMNNSFAERRHSGKIPVFTYHYRDYLLRGPEYWERKKAVTDSVNWAAEYELDYLASVAGVLIKPEWVQASIDAHKKLDIEPTGIKQGAFDPADEGQDNCAFAARHGIVVTHLQTWSGKGSTLHASTEQGFALADELQLAEVQFDGDGMGAGVRAAATVIAERRRENKQRSVAFESFRGSAGVRFADARAPGTDTLNKDRYYNLAAQSWFTLKDRFEATFRAVNGAKDVNLEDIISLSSAIKELSQLCVELSMPVWRRTGTGKIIVEKHEGGVSPDRADCLKMMLGVPNLGLAAITAAQWDAAIAVI